MKVNFELYKVFYYSALYSNFSKAGKKLFISQSAVSQSIKQLESQLNTTLFFRKNKKISLTPQGEDLFSYIEKAFILIESGERTIQEKSELQKKELRIAASDTICKYYLIPYFKEFNEKNPDIKLKIINRTSPVCISLLEEGAIDLAIVNLPEKYSINSTLEVKIIREIQDVFIAGNKYKELSEKNISLRDIKDYPFLLLEKNSTTRLFLDKFLEGQNIKINTEIELESVDLLVELTKIGLGVSFVIREAVEDDIDKGSIIAIDIAQKTPARSLGLLKNNGLPLSESSKKFIKLFA